MMLLYFGASARLNYLKNETFSCLNYGVWVSHKLDTSKVPYIIAKYVQPFRTALRLEMGFRAKWRDRQGVYPEPSMYTDLELVQGSYRRDIIRDVRSIL